MTYITIQLPTPSVCDYGYTGFDCSQRECARGDDTRTLKSKHEVVTMYCKCRTTCR